MQTSILLLVLSAVPSVFALPGPNPLGHRNQSPSGSLDDGQFCPGRQTSPGHQHEIFAQFVQKLYGDKHVADAFDTYISADLIEHDPFDEQGRAPNAAKLEAIIPYSNFSVLRWNFDRTIGMIHVKVDEQPEPAAFVDLYRMNGTCIVEHWDVVQYLPANATNPIAMF